MYYYDILIKRTSKYLNSVIFSFVGEFFLRFSFFKKLFECFKPVFKVDVSLNNGRLKIYILVYTDIIILFIDLIIL